MNEWKLDLTKTTWGQEELRDIAKHMLRILQAWDSVPRSKTSEQTNTELVMVLDKVASGLFETGWF